MTGWPVPGIRIICDAVFSHQPAFVVKKKQFAEHFSCTRRPKFRLILTGLPLSLSLPTSSSSSPSVGERLSVSWEGLCQLGSTVVGMLEQETARRRRRRRRQRRRQPTVSSYTSKALSKEGNLPSHFGSWWCGECAQVGRGCLLLRRLEKALQNVVQFGGSGSALSEASTTTTLSVVVDWFAVTSWPSMIFAKICRSTFCAADFITYWCTDGLPRTEASRDVFEMFHWN